MEPPVPLTVADEFTIPMTQGNVRLSSDRMRVLETSESRESSLEPPKRAKFGVFARRSLGIILLLITVFFWTASNFLASSIFADNTYSKPYFVTYVNTAFFAVPLIPMIIKHQYKTYNNTGSLWNPTNWRYVSQRYNPFSSEERIAFLTTDEEETRDDGPYESERASSELNDGQSLDTTEGLAGKLSMKETAKLSFEFSFLWFIANYFIAACLKYTTVASATILTSTSGIWTLAFGALIAVEKFTLKKLIGVLMSFGGVALISTIDLSSNNDDNRGSFPHKSHRQIAIGNSMAFFSAMMYGLYTTLMKKRIGNEDRVNMPLFFGLVGVFNVVLLWPGFFILHYTGEETFLLPPTGKIWLVVIINSTTSFLSDVCWAYAMLLTSPLVVTVGLSLTIPLSLVGQMILSAQYSTATYWIGACIVLVSFIFINHESADEQARLERTWHDSQPAHQSGT